MPAETKLASLPDGQHVYGQLRAAAYLPLCTDSSGSLPLHSGCPTAQGGHSAGGEAATGWASTSWGEDKQKKHSLMRSLGCSSLGLGLHLPMEVML